MAGKKVEFRSDGNRNVVIKEVIKRGSSVRGPKHTISICLNSDFQLANRYVMQDNIVTPIESLGKSKTGKREKPVYYVLSEISYIATITYQCNRQGKVVDNTFALYIIEAVCGEKDLYCHRVTAGLNLNARKELVEVLSPYCLQRLGLKK